MAKKETMELPQEVNKESKTIKMKAITQELSNALVEYLNTKPHGEVRGLIDTLSSTQTSPIIDVTFTNGAA